MSVMIVEPQSGFNIAFNMFDTDGDQRVDKREFLVVSPFHWPAVNIEICDIRFFQTNGNTTLFTVLCVKNDCVILVFSGYHVDYYNT